MEESGGGSGSGKLELPQDGFEWKKYGHKFIKNIAKFRAYYKCAREGCMVKKKVEYSKSEPDILRITYEGGQHNHDASSSRESGSSRGGGGGSSSDANRYNLITQVFGDNTPS